MFLGRLTESRASGSGFICTKKTEVNIYHCTQAVPSFYTSSPYRAWRADLIKWQSNPKQSLWLWSHTQSSTTLWTQTVNFRLSGHGWHTPVSPELRKQRARDYVVQGHLKLHCEIESYKTDKNNCFRLPSNSQFSCLSSPLLTLEAHPGSGQWWSSSSRFSSHMVKTGITYLCDTSLEHYSIHCRNNNFQHKDG